MKELITELERIGKYRENRDFEKALPILKSVLENIPSIQKKYLINGSYEELKKLSRSFISLVNTCIYWEKIISQNENGAIKKHGIQYKFSQVLLKLLETGDKDLITEYEKAVDFLMKRECGKKELLAEGLLNAVLDVDNIQLIIKSFKNPIFRYIVYNTTKSLPIDFPEAWSHSDGYPMLKALLSTRYKASYCKEKELIKKNMGNILSNLFVNKAEFNRNPTTPSQRLGDCSLANARSGRISENANIPHRSMHHQLKTDGIFAFNYIDWGPGDGIKTGLIVENALKIFDKANVCLADCSEDMINVSEGNVGKYGKNVCIIKAYTSFGRLAENPEYKKIKGRKFHSFLGTTFCNFDPKLICRILKNTLGKGDYALIGVHLYEEGHDTEILEAYNSKEMVDVSYQGLKEIGFGEYSPLELRHKNILIKSNEPKIGKLTKLITYFEVQKTMKKGLLVYNKGDQIPAILSIKYTEEQFKKVIGSFFDIVKVITEDETGLFLVRSVSKK